MKTNIIIHVKNMNTHSTYSTVLEPSSLKHGGITLTLAEMQAQNASEQLDGDLTYASLKSH